MVTSSPTRMPPASRAAFQVRPKSLRLIFATAERPTRVLPDGSLPGAVLGGLVIGLVESLWQAYVSADYKDVVAFAVLAGTLVMRPQGLLGRPEVEKV